MKEKLKELAVWVILLPVYIQVRLMYLPILWVPIPGYVHWATTRRDKEVNGKSVQIFYFINRDLPRLLAVYLYFGFSLLVSWLTWWPFVYGMLSTGILMLSTSILYWVVMKFVKE